ARSGVLLAIVVLALGLRVGAGLALPSLSRDEANDVFVSREASTVGALLQSLTIEGSPPLRFLLLEWPIHRAFPTSTWPLRLAEFVLGVLGVGLVTATGWWAYGETAGLAAGLLMATAPYFIHASLSLRSQSLYQVLAASYALAMVWLLDTPTIARAALAGLLGGLLMLTHYYGLFVVAPTLLYSASWLRREGRPWRPVLLAGTVALAVCLPWLPFLAAQLRNPLRPGAVPRHTWLAAVQVIPLTLGSLGVPPVPTGLGAWAWRQRRTRRELEGAASAAPGFRLGPTGLLLVGALGANLLAWGIQWIGGLHAPVYGRYLIGPAVWLVPVLGA